MPAFHLAVRAQRGESDSHDVLAATTPASPGPLTGPTRLALACQCADPQAFSVRARPVLRTAATPEAALQALAPEACLVLFIEPDTLIVRARHAVRAQHAVPVRHAALQYLRLADATVKPLPPDPAPLQFTAGDTYIALSPGALQVADSPAIARFIHLRDYFNAETLAAALLNHLLGLGGAARPPADLTVLVLEAR